MELTEYAKLAAFENKYWWHVGRRSIVARQIVKLHRERHDLHILNVGSGTGGTVEILAEHGKVLNIDQSGEAVRLMRESGYEALQMDGANTPLENEQFDLVAALDVLEHIQEDKSALQEWGRLLKPGGYVLLTVPAYQWLWSGHDVFLEHKRRYRLGEIEAALRDAGLSIVKGAYYFGLVFPLAAAVRLAARGAIEPKSSLKKHGGLTNGLLTAICAAELPLFPINRLAGLSVFVLAKKP